MASPRSKALAAAAVCLAFCCAMAQVGAHAKALALEASRNRDWPAAVDGFQKVVASDPGDGESWYRLGFAQHSLERYRDAVASYKRSIALKFGLSNSYYNLACAYARMGESDQALDALEKAIGAGYTMTQAIQADEDLDSVRDSPRYQALFSRAQRPVLHYSQGGRLNPLEGAWSVQGNGTLTANVRSKEFARTVEAVVDGTRRFHLMFYFVAPENAWKVAGADSLGGFYEGPVSWDGDTVVCAGKRMNEGAIERLELRLALTKGRPGTVACGSGNGGERRSVWGLVLSGPLEVPGGR